jgi:reactive intermediate/imine deaminase
MTLVGGFIVPGMPHPLLAPQKNAGWQNIRDSFAKLRDKIASLDAELLVLYSTQWPSVIGHQIQADPEPHWVHVDPEWHELGDMPYDFRIDAEFAKHYQRCAEKRGLHARTVAYQGFPIDTGSIVALKLLNPDNARQATIVSCNMYADRAETLVLGKAARDAIDESGKRTVAVAVSAFSNRLHTQPMEAKDDHISSLKDDEWNRKILQFLAEGRLEDVSQLARQFTREANADNKFKAIWWLASLMGQHNSYQGQVHAYEAIWGTGAGVVSLEPASIASGEQEFDEDDVEFYGGDRNVLGGDDESVGSDEDTGTSFAASSVPASNVVHTQSAPKPVGAYPHARRVGSMLYLSGVGPRQTGTNEIPGGPVRNADGHALDYDVRAQTQAVIDNVEAILKSCGASLEDVVDITVFLIDMDRDFQDFNEIYAKTFAPIEATRTTLAIQALPTPIAVEFKVVAQLTQS